MSKRRRFFLTYLTTAVVASIVVFFGTPLVRASISTQRFERMSQACRSDAPLSGLFASLANFRRAPAPEPDFDRPPGEQPRIPHNRTTTTTRVTPDTPPYQSVSIPDKTSKASNTNPPPAPVYDYTAMWAIVTNNTGAVYDGEGRLAQELPSGSLIEIASVRTNLSERLAICRYDTKSPTIGTAYIRTRDLLIRKGSLDSANADLVTLLRKQVQLETEIRTLMANFATELAKRNPHSDAYNRAHETVIAFNDTAKKLRAKADRSQGSARVEMMDKLRSMKEEGVQLRKVYDAAKSAFDTWNSEHSIGAQENEPAKALQQELADVRKQAGRLDTN